jgi:hypothetical protein
MRRTSGGSGYERLGLIWRSVLLDARTVNLQCTKPDTDCFRGGQATNVRLNHFIHNALAANEELTLWVHLTSEPTRVEEEIIHALQPPWNLRGRRP